MRNYWEKVLFPQFLKTIDDCTLSELPFIDIQEQLNDLAIKSISSFKFPKISLEYKLDDTVNPDTGLPYGYYFVNDVTQREYNVIIARMKQHWVEYQISQERLFDNLYYDREIRIHSPGNTIDKLLKMMTTFKKIADDAEYNYGRVSSSGQPTLGEINE